MLDLMSYLHDIPTPHRNEAQTTLENYTNGTAYRIRAIFPCPSSYINIRAEPRHDNKRLKVFKQPPHRPRQVNMYKLVSLAHNNYRITDVQQRKNPKYEGPRWLRGQATRLPHLGEQGSIPCGIAPACGNCGGRCQVDLPLPLTMHSGAAPYSPRFTLIGSQDHDVKSRPDLSTPLRNLIGRVTKVFSRREVIFAAALAAASAAPKASFLGGAAPVAFAAPAFHAAPFAYAAPAFHAAPLAYAAPAAAVVRTYAAPAAIVKSYAAPAAIVKSYAAPALIRTTYTAPAVVRTVHTAPALIRTVHTAPALIKTVHAAPLALLLAFYQGEPGFNLRSGHSGFSHVGMVPDLPFCPPFHSGATPYSPHFTLNGSQDLAVKVTDLVYAAKRQDGNTARLARRSDEALGVRVSVARIAPSLLDLTYQGTAYKLNYNLAWDTNPEPPAPKTGDSPTDCATEEHLHSIAEKQSTSVEQCTQAITKSSSTRCHKSTAICVKFSGSGYTECCYVRAYPAGPLSCRFATHRSVPSRSLGDMRGLACQGFSRPLYLFLPLKWSEGDIPIKYNTELSLEELPQSTWRELRTPATHAKRATANQTRDSFPEPHAANEMATPKSKEQPRLLTRSKLFIEEGMEKEQAKACSKKPFQLSPRVISGTHGKPKSGWPCRNSTPCLLEGKF
ncbi:hypothetical protein PR048_010440 [Dryococelus australis]|uniref:Uncharacterized protein n=1 Tax=Dryococelus australis TaxID=614101 RepID=A0ABQ9I3L0_9NEOP|nr:hypothetical protein PR048_010440 [Dryococelus australis]